MLSHLGSIDYYAVKVSCRRLFHTRGTLRQSLDNLKDNAWNEYQAKVWL